MRESWLVDERHTLSAADEGEASLVSYGFDASADLPPLSVVLHDVTIHKTRRLFGAADIRLDAIAVTVPAPDGSTELYQPRTFTFPGVGEGDRLPIDNGLLLYLGQPRHFLDLAITASPDMADTPDLAALLAEEADSVGDATSSLLALASPQAMAIGAAATAAGKIAATALRLLQARTGKTIGLYRTTWFEHRDRLGVGRHPSDGLSFRQKDLEFWYEIFRDMPPES